MKSMFKQVLADIVASYWWLKAEHFPLWVAAHAFVLAALIGVVLSIAN